MRRGRDSARLGFLPWLENLLSACVDEYKQRIVELARSSMKRAKLKQVPEQIRPIRQDGDPPVKATPYGC